MHHSGHLRRQLWDVIKNIGHNEIGHVALRSGAERIDKQAAKIRPPTSFKQWRKQHTVSTTPHDSSKLYHDHATVESISKQSSSKKLQRVEKEGNQSERKRSTKAGRLNPATSDAHENGTSSSKGSSRNSQTRSRGFVKRSGERIPSDPPVARNNRFAKKKRNDGQVARGHVLAGDSRAVESEVENQGTARHSVAGISANIEPSPRWAEPPARTNVRRRAEATQKHHDMRRWHVRDDIKDWRSILAILEIATPTDPSVFEKRLDTVTLKEGAVAVFNGDSREAILEIMQRTGSHVQVALAKSQSDPVLETLKLLGTREQNDHAFKILHKYLRPMTQDDLNASKDLSDYLLRSKSSRDDQPSAYIREPAAHQFPTQIEESENGAALQKPSAGSHAQDHHAVAQAVDINNEAGEDRKQTQDLQDSGTQPAVPLRAVWNRHSDEVRTVETASPSIALTQTIEELTRRTPRLVRRKNHGPQSPKATNAYVENATRHLLTLLTPPSVSPVLSSDALETALRFLVRYGKYEELRTVIESLDKSGFKFSPPTFDTLFTAASKQGSIPNFRFALLLMLRRKIDPTPRTWALLFALLCQRYHSGKTSFAEVTFFREKIQERGFTKLHEIALEISEYAMLMDIQRFLDSIPQQPVASFITQKDLSAGVSDWFTPSSLNRILHALLNRGLMNEAMTVLAIYRSRHGKVRSDTLNTMLAAAVTDVHPSNAVVLLQTLASQSWNNSLRLDELSYKLLMTITWSGQYFNMFRVMWRYACMAGHISYSFQQRVERSLISWAPADENPSRRAVWAAWAGKFCVGISQGLPNTVPVVTQREEYSTAQDDEDNVVPVFREPPSTEELTGQLQDLVELASEPTPGRSEQVSGLYSARRKRLRAMLQADLDEVRSLRPVLPLVTLLEQALEKDLRWKQRGLGVPKGLQKGERYNGQAFIEMMRHRIRVPVVVGDGTRASSFATSLWAPAPAPVPDTVQQDEDVQYSDLQ